jgi:hypothetical protein
MNLIVNILQYIPHINRVNAADSIDTAIGTLPTTLEGPDGIVSVVLRYSTFIGGIVAVAMLAIGGFGLMTSAGDPEKLMNAKETISNALMGLALIVLSVFILELLGVSILGISYLDSKL